MPSYIAGVFYHCGIATALIYLFIALFNITVSGTIIVIAQVLMLMGGLCGAGLLIKRIMSEPMRVISYIDDYASNIIVDIFILTALLCSRMPAFIPVMFIVAIIMFLYIPVGKIRHCFFFFLTRILFGTYYGRRGVFPAEKHY